MRAEPQKEHEWLRQLVGDWTIEAASPDDPDNPLQGAETVRALGDLWIVAEGEGENGQSQQIMSATYRRKK